MAVVAPARAVESLSTGALRRRMYEVEVKVAAPLDRVRERLHEAGAEARGAVTELDTYYEHPTRSFADTDEALRIRRTDGDATLTYKGPRVDDATKTRREIETLVADPEAVGAVLEALGFEPAAEVRKERERYALEGYTVALDEVEDLGEYVEVEAVGEADEVDTLRAGAVSVLERLGLEAANGVRDSYLELLDDAPG